LNVFLRSAADEIGDAASAPIGSGKKRATGRQAFVQGYARRPPDPTIVAIDREMHAVRDHIREFVKVERALV
jgi:hypothetical protein